MSDDALEIDTPRRDWLGSYAEALGRGWSPDNLRDVSKEQLAALSADPDAFLASLTAQGGTIALPDGSTRPKLPDMQLWLWDGSFCGRLGLRWQKGTRALPEHVLGHIGYTIVPWKRGRGYATRALTFALAKAAEVGLEEVEITTEAENLASRRVIAKNGGRLVGVFDSEIYGMRNHLRFLVPTRRNLS